ncbi:integrin alpha-4-like [Chrysoperla carnea]|uniref:integrin alpha-4-like n=1 Tax=Chrysoperla carnea TaxID=189513 RepID=UPI001D06A79E|nr:integrin alpha-4-like [Chrysoperla carnea]
MDVDLTTGRTVICGSRWTIIDHRLDHPNLTMGVCYVTVNKLTLPILPLHEKGQYYYTLNITKRPVKIMQQANGLAGFSAHFPKKSKVAELLLGAPGVFDRNGATILYQPDSKTFKNKNNKLNTDVLFKNEIINYFYLPRNADNYIGYQVSSGNFIAKSDILYVTSAPRTLNCTGQVGIMKFPNKTPDPKSKNPYVDDKKKLFSHTIDGTQVGEYFGASLEVTDLNNDGLDDLIVGSPFYTKHMEEGRVYIYLGRSKNFGDKESTYIDGNVPGGRFGTAISSLGDIDGDKYSDFVVGAPYEDEYRGAIYIYNGCDNEKGLSSRKPQRIRAIEINSILKGFGISMARPMDLDGDKHEDLAVGSHLSGHVVVLRSCPTAIFEAKFETNSTTIKGKETKFRINACIKYTGKNIPYHTSILRYFKTDTTRTTCEQDLRPKNVTLTKDGPNCEEFEFSVKNDANFMRPITIAMAIEFIPPKIEKSTMWIGNEGTEGSDKFTNECLVMNDQLSKLKDTIDMNFEVQCSGCECDLNLNATFLSHNEVIDTYTIGSNQPLALTITITNNGDATAFYSKLYIKLPNQMEIAQTSCEGNKTYLECRLNNRFETNQTIALVFDMDIISYFDRLKTPETNLTFEISITTKTDEKYSNHIVSTLELIREVGIQITGKAEQETYSNTEEHKINESISFEHSYEIHKFGVSPLENMLINLFVPTEYSTLKGNTYTIAVIDKIHGYFAGKEISCQVLNGTVQNETLFYNNSSSFNESELITNSLSEDRTFMLNCFENLVKCSQIVCPIESVIYSDQRIKLNLKVNLSIPMIQDKLIGIKKFIQYSTNVFAKIEDYTEIKLLSNDSMHTATVTTIFSLGLPGKISLWIIVTAAGIGIVALLLLIFLLSKCGFFRREKKKQLENLIQEEKRRTMMEIESFNYEETFDVPIN